MTGLVGGWWYGFGRKNWNNDIRVVVLGQEELGLLSISFERRMINLVKVSGSTKVWIPGGLSWYPVNRIPKILAQEQKNDLLSQIVFYNFGFLTRESIMTEEVDNWQDELMQSDWRKWLRYKVEAEEMLPKTEELSGEWLENSQIDELAVRDLADSRLVNEEMRLVVINASSEVGLANFVAQRLTWAGLTVTDIDKGDIFGENCVVKLSERMKQSQGVGVLKQQFGCRLETIVDDSSEVELYLGDKLAEMLNYSSYNR